MRKFNNHSGFSLVELSIVLVIIGIIVSASIKLVGPVTQIIKMRETKERLDSALQSVVGYAASHNSIPDNISSIVAVPRSSWGKDFAYLYDPSFSSNPTKDTICGRSSSGLKVHTREPSSTTNNVAFAIVSSTEDWNFSSDLDSVKITGSAQISGTVSAPNTLNIDLANKDMVRFITVGELRTRIGCQGPPLKIVNNELPLGIQGNPYSATIFADGGVPYSSSNYKFCVNNNIISYFNISGGISAADCSSADWSTATASANVIITFANPATVAVNSYRVTVFVRDNTSEDPTSKIFNITVNSPYPP